MAGSFLQTLQREKRRLGFVMLMGYLAGWLFYLRVDVQIGGVPLPLVTGVLYAVLLSLSTLAICIVAPSLCFMIEPLAVSRLVISIFVVTNPGPGGEILTNPLLMAGLVVGGAVFISRAMRRRDRALIPQTA